MLWGSSESKQIIRGLKIIVRGCSRECPGQPTPLNQSLSRTVPSSSVKPGPAALTIIGEEPQSREEEVRGAPTPDWTRPEPRLSPTGSALLLLLLLSGARRTAKSWPLSFSQEELKKRLTPLQYHVTQERGTERAFTGEFTDHKEEGTYTCAVCGTAIFSSSSKFDSGSGWPSFFDIMKEDSISLSDDFSHGMHRVEATCSQCGAHLGHLFDDGPRPTGKRYCINSASLDFQHKDADSNVAAGDGAAGTSGSDGKTEL